MPHVTANYPITAEKFSVLEMDPVPCLVRRLSDWIRLSYGQTTLGEDSMSDRIEQARHNPAKANRILAHEGFIDAFGHVSMRHPTHPDCCLISQHRACELIHGGDTLELTAGSVPVTPTSHRLYGDVVIHGCIYQGHPEVQAICHHHSGP
jgi:hypothetical protein